MKKGFIILGSVICSLTILLIICNLLKSGYVYENGTWNYVSYDEGAGRSVYAINVDKNEFRVIKYTDFARDNKSMYYKCTKLEGSDPDTFKIISNKSRYCYAKDKNNVYVYTSDGGSIYKVINADPNSFEVLEFPYSKDKNDAYCLCLPLFVDDIDKFEVVEGAGSAIESSVESFLGTESSLEDKSSEYELSKHKYNRKKYGFINDWVFYSEDGQAKTDKLVYKGYRLVEDKQ